MVDEKMVREAVEDFRKSVAGMDWSGTREARDKFVSMIDAACSAGLMTVEEFREISRRTHEIEKVVKFKEFEELKKGIETAMSEGYMAVMREERRKQFEEEMKSEMLTCF